MACDWAYVAHLEQRSRDYGSLGDALEKGGGCMPGRSAAVPAIGAVIGLYAARVYFPPHNRLIWPKSERISLRPVELPWNRHGEGGCA